MSFILACKYTVKLVFKIFLEQEMEHTGTRWNLLLSSRKLRFSGIVEQVSEC